MGGVLQGWIQLNALFVSVATRPCQPLLARSLFRTPDRMQGVPDDSCILVRQSDGSDVEVPSSKKLLQPGIAAVIRLALKRPDSGSCPMNEQGSH